MSGCEEVCTCTGQKVEKPGAVCWICTPRIVVGAETTDRASDERITILLQPCFGQLGCLSPFLRAGVMDDQSHGCRLRSCATAVPRRLSVALCVQRR